jgi:phosphatidylglycerol---prolipoprotein diacylglyceryl transferase
MKPYIWDVNRYLFESENVKITYYGVTYVLSFIFSFIVNLKLHKNWLEALQFIVLLAIVSVIGGRLFYVFFYNPQLLSQGITIVFKTWKGGISSHGSLVGIFFAVYLFAHEYKKKYILYLDNALLLILVSGFFIRLGNFFNSEKVGSITNGKWGIIFLNDTFSADFYLPKHPVQLYESLVCILLFLLIFMNYQKYTKGQVSSMVLIGLFGARFVIGYFFNSNILPLEQLCNVATVILGLFIHYFYHTKHHFLVK